MRFLNDDVWTNIWTYDGDLQEHSLPHNSHFGGSVDLKHFVSCFIVTNLHHFKNLQLCILRLGASSLGG